MNEPNVKKDKELCPVYKKCSGCQLMNMTYEEQLRFKQIKVERLMGKLCRPELIVGMDDPVGYRYKVTAVYDFKGGKSLCGVYQSATGGVIDVKSCAADNPKADSIARQILKTANAMKISLWSSYGGQGFLRYAMIRIAKGTGEIMCVIGGTDNDFPSKKHFTAELMKKCPEITSLVFTVCKPDRIAPGTKYETLHGKDYIEDIICGKKFRISPKSFAQINPVQTEKLYSLAIKYAALTGKETVIDAYCGIGTLSLIAADKARTVYGCEINRAAINDAVINAKLNKAENVKFICADSGEFLEEFTEEKLRADVVIMDPARAGADRRFLSNLVKIAPKRIVYVSCNPETQSRDVFFLIKNGYKIKKLSPVDMFPFTSHVETVVLLSHKKPDGHINVKVEFGEGEGKVPLDNIAKRAESYKPKERVTYKMIKEYIEAKYGFKVHTAYIAEVKRDLGLPMYDAPNAVEELKQPRKHPTPEKVEAIKDALKHFEVI